MMDHEETGESAINLSTNHHTTRSNSSPTPNGSTADIKNGDVQASKPQKSKSSHSALDGASLASLSPSVLMMSPQLLIRQQMQQLLQQQVISPSQIQQLFNQHQSLFLQQQQQQQQLKQLESMIPQLQEQLHLNMVQQTQILQQLNSVAVTSAGEKVNNNRQQLQVQLQHLAVQQHHLMQQIQLGQQQQYLFGIQPLALPQGLSPSDLQNIWKDNSGSNQEENGAKISGLNGLLHSPPPLISTQSSTVPPLLNGQNDASTLSASLPSGSNTSVKEDNCASSPAKNPLYGHGVCRWPGCETVCETQQAFLKHINTEHQLDDRSTAQARVQMQVVSQLELQLAKEKERLQAMMQHLHMAQSSPSTSNSSPSKMETPVTSSAKMSRLSPQLPTVASSSCSPTLSAAVTTMSATTPLVSVPSRMFPQTLHPPLPGVGAIRRRLNDKSYSSISDVPLLPDSPIRRRVAERSNLDINEEITRNREFYRTADVRPPFTYASLIRQAIVEAADKQLTLNEIYNWFQNTFCYFRRNAATWKNAVRHNLSLHKCFMRVENVKGAVWTVDELEFYKRRPQRIQERVSGSLSQSQDANQVGSPPLHHNPGLYGDSLNASLQAALAENNMSFLNSTTSVNSLVSSSLLALTTTSSPSSLNPSLSSESDCFNTEMTNHNDSNKLPSGEIQVKQEPMGNDPELENAKPQYFTDDSQQDVKCHSSEGSEDMDVAEDLSLSSSETHATLCPRGGCL